MRSYEGDGGAARAGAPASLAAGRALSWEQALACACEHSRPEHP